MLKQYEKGDEVPAEFQPPSGGCVLKRAVGEAACLTILQPPSGGCVLKQDAKLEA